MATLCARQRVAKHGADVEQWGVFEPRQARWHRQRRAERVVRVSQRHAIRVEYGDAGGYWLDGLLQAFMEGTQIAAHQCG